MEERVTRSSFFVVGQFKLSLAVILRKRSPSLREGLPTKDPCIPDDSRFPTSARFVEALPSWI
jgi:hypothetical protein